MKWRYSKEEMERYFNDPEYRKSSRKKSKILRKETRPIRLAVISALYCWQRDTQFM